LTSTYVIKLPTLAKPPYSFSKLTLTNRLASQTDTAWRGTVPLSLAKLTSFYITPASKPTSTLVEGTVPFFASLFRRSGP
jgi:hypothetical protein